jgi:hypothetical protein
MSWNGESTPTNGYSYEGSIFPIVIAPLNYSMRIIMKAANGYTYEGSIFL